MKIGSDIECFIFDTHIGEFVPAAEVIGMQYNKYNPLQLKTCTAHYDNLALEYQVIPAPHPDIFFTNHIKAATEIKKTVASINSKYVVKYRPVVKFSKKAITHPTAYEFYCNPDYNIYNTVSEKLLSSSPYRFAGGHIHFSFGLGGVHIEQDMNFYEALILSCDVFFVASSMQLDLYPKQETFRRRFYGAAGSFRLPAHGLEIRAPSNIWMKSKSSIRTVSSGIFRIYRNAGTFPSYVETSKKDIYLMCKSKNPALYKKHQKRFMWFSENNTDSFIVEDVIEGI